MCPRATHNKNTNTLFFFALKSRQTIPPAPPFKQEAFGDAENALNNAIVDVNAAVGQAKVEKYDKIGQTTGRYYCTPGYRTFPDRRRRLQQYQSSKCKECGLNAYCPGGFQTLTNPNKVDCPLPEPGTGVTEFTTGTVTTGSSRDACIASCVPGTFAPDPVYGPCDPCGYGYYCPGGFQGGTGFNTARFPCPQGTNTTITDATNPNDCVKF